MEAKDGRVRTWAEIAAYIGRDARTAQRYERTAGLPVRRMSGAMGASVYALRSELDGWLKERVPASSESASDDPVSDTSFPEALSRPSRGRWTARFRGAAVVATALALGVGATLLMARARPAAAEPSPQARTLYQQGVYAWNRRTKEGLAQATDAFTQAVVLDPAYAAAYVGLADCYNLAPEFGGMAPVDAYPRGLAAASRAVALDPSSAGAHRALGFAEFWWRQDAPRGLSEMRKAESLDPRSALTHHWLANMLAIRADPAALGEIDQALAADPSTATMADKGYVLEMLGRLDEADAVLRKVVQLEPAYAQAHDYRIILARRRGDEAAVLSETREVAQLRGNAAEVADAKRAEETLQTKGRMAALTQVAADQEQLLATGRGDSFQTALAESDLHRRDATLSLFAKALADHRPAMLSLATNPDFAWLRSDPRFKQLISGAASAKGRI